MREFTAGSSESTPTAMPLDKQDSAWWGHDQQDGVWNLSHRQYAVAQPCVALAPISVYSRSHVLCKLVPAIWLLPCRAVPSAVPVGQTRLHSPLQTYQQHPSVSA